MLLFLFLHLYLLNDDGEKNKNYTVGKFLYVKKKVSFKAIKLNLKQKLDFNDSLRIKDFYMFLLFYF